MDPNLLDAQLLQIGCMILQNHTVCQEADALDLGHPNQFFQEGVEPFLGERLPSPEIDVGDALLDQGPHQTKKLRVLQTSSLGRLLCLELRHTVSARKVASIGHEQLQRILYLSFACHVPYVSLDQ